MSPLENYLNKVRTKLPRKGRDDVLQELRTALLERLDRQEEEWGRPLTEAEQSTIVRGFGNPYAIAARYWTGTGLFGGPFAIYYRMTMMWAVAAIFIAHVGLMIWRAARGLPIAKAVSMTMPGMVWALLTAFFVITLVFMALDSGRSRQRRSHS
jgi:hypothetical protein